MVDGFHLMLHCYGCNEEKLKDSRFLSEVLEGLLWEIEINLDAPENPFDELQEKRETGTLNLVASDSGHAFAHAKKEGNCFLSLYSSNEFDYEKIESLILNAFEVEEYTREITGLLN